jgi:hypothetical protein
LGLEQTRTLHIRNKVFSKGDIQKISRILLSQLEYSKQNGGLAKTLFSIHCSDGTHYQSDTPDIFENDHEIDLKKANSIEMEYFDYELNRRITFSIEHGNHYLSRNRITVHGTDSNWVIGTFTSLKETIEAVKPQPSWVLRYKWLVYIFNVVLFGLALEWLIHFVTKHFYFPVAFVLGGILAMVIDDRLPKLWPDIEFDFGPEHTRREKRIRAGIYVLAELVAIPLAVSALYDVIKGNL